jgi:hypothetical protein
MHIRETLANDRLQNERKENVNKSEYPDMIKYAEKGRGFLKERS